MSRARLPAHSRAFALLVNLPSTLKSPQKCASLEPLAQDQGGGVFNSGHSAVKGVQKDTV